MARQDAGRTEGADPTALCEGVPRIATGFNPWGRVGKYSLPILTGSTNGDAPLPDWWITGGQGPLISLRFPGIESRGYSESALSGQLEERATRME